MIWHDYVVVAKQQTGIDQLNNPIYADAKIGTVEGRITEWTAVDVDILGRDFTVANRKLLIIHPIFDLPRDIQIVIDDIKYDVTSIKHLGSRFILLYVKGYRV